MIAGAAAERPVIFPLALLDRQVVDAGDAQSHQPVLVEFPVLVAVAAEPIPAVVVPLIGKPNRDAVLAKGPDLFDQPVVELAAPFACQERLDSGAALRRARQQLSGFLLRQGCHYGRPAWTKLHRRWLAGLKFEQAVHHIVLEEYIAAVEAAEARRDRLTAQIEAMLPDWTLAPVVAALQTMRGMALVNAATLIAELGDPRASAIRAS